MTTVDQSFENLQSGSESLTLAKRIELCIASLDSLNAAAGDWVHAAIAAKGIEGTPFVAEDMLTGPAVVMRQLQLSLQTLRRLENGQDPRLPGSPEQLANGQVSIPVFPTSGFWDGLTFMGLSASVRMQPGVSSANIFGERSRGRLDEVRNDSADGIAAVLGAGNVSSIPATDSLNKMLFDRKRVILKFNPVNDYLAPIFSRAFEPFVSAGLLQIVTGGAKVGSEIIGHDAVDEVHITGSTKTHDAIVWGSDPEDAARRKRENDPLFAKPVTSELGNVTPWIIVPGKYSRRELASQAEHIAASITNNASFNCLATKLIVTWENWPQREEFLNLLQKYLDQTPDRPAYYPGAVERFARFAGQSATDRVKLPWTLLADQKIADRPELFHEESFVCVCAETQLPAKSPVSFVDTAIEFVNDQVFGTLCASITFPGDFRRSESDAVERALSRLKYGSVCINQWSGLAYGLISPPWGAYPGSTLADVKSGIGNVHNTYLLDDVEKTVLQGPLVNFPKPIWFPSHAQSPVVARRLLGFFHQPSVLRLPALFAAALRG